MNKPIVSLIALFSFLGFYQPVMADITLKGEWGHSSHGWRLEHDNFKYSYMTRGLQTNNLEFINYAATAIDFLTKTNTSDPDAVSRLFIKNDGKVGINTTTPSTRFDVVGDIMVEGEDGWNSNDDEAEVALGSVPGQFYIKAVYGYGLKFGVYSGADAFVIKEVSGNVGVGTTNPLKKLYVNGSAGGTQAWNASDKREKIDVKSIKNALDNVSKLRGVSYKWKQGDENETKGFDKKTHFGVIAQEVEKIYPELVDNLGNTERRKHVEYNALIGILIEAVKELKTQNKVQQAEIEELRLKIQSLNG